MTKATISGLVPKTSGPTFSQRKNGNDDDDDYDDADAHDNSEFKNSADHLPASIWGLGFEIGFGP